MRARPDVHCSIVGYGHCSLLILRCFVSKRFASPVRTRRGLLAALPALGLAGIGGRAWAQQRLERPDVTLALGGRTSLYHLPVALADQLGYFAQEGLKVDLLDQAGGGLAKQVLVSGKADLVAGAYEHVIMLRQQGQNCRAFVLQGRAPQLAFGVGSRALPDFQHVRELRGRRIGVTGVDSGTHSFARLVLARAGVAAGEVEFVPVGTSTAAATALREGRIDAIANIDPVISLLEFRGEIRVVADARSLRGTQELYGGPMPGGSLYAPQSFIVRYPRTVQALTNAMVRSLKWLQTAGPSDLVRAIPEAWMSGDRAIYLAAFEKAREAFSPDGLLSEEAVLTAHRIVARFETQAGTTVVRAPAPGTTYTNEFVERARIKYVA